MVIVKHNYIELLQYCDKNLHSNMVIVKLTNLWDRDDLLLNLHSNMVIVKPDNYL